MVLGAARVAQSTLLNAPTVKQPIVGMGTSREGERERQREIRHGSLGRRAWTKKGWDDAELRLAFAVLVAVLLRGVDASSEPRGATGPLPGRTCAGKAGVVKLAGRAADVRAGS